MRWDLGLRPLHYPEHSTTQLEPWEADFVDFSRVCKAGKYQTSGGGGRRSLQISLMRCATLQCKLFWSPDYVSRLLTRKISPNGKRKQHLKDLRKLCSMFGILPSSFVLTPTFDERETTPFAMGGFSEVYAATLGGRRVAVKALKIVNVEAIESVRKVGRLLLPSLEVAHTRPQAPCQRGCRMEVASP
jgi:hypothetical protein